MLCSEKHGRPEKVQGELSEEKRDWFRFSNTFRASMPDESEADPDHGVERGPDRAKKPVGWCSRRTGEGGIPGWDRAGSQEGSKAAEDLHDDDAKNDLGRE